MRCWPGTQASRLRVRINQLYDRVETELRNILRDAELYEGLRSAVSQGIAANLLLAFAEGRISQWVRSGFKRRPIEGWLDQWPVLMEGFFKPTALARSVS